MKKFILAFLLALLPLTAAFPYFKDGPWVDIPLDQWVLLDENTNYFISALGKKWDMGLMPPEDSEIEYKPLKKRPYEIYKPEIALSMHFYKEKPTALSAKEYQRINGRKLHRSDGTLQFYISPGMDYVDNPDMEIRSVKFYMDSSMCYTLAAEIAEPKHKHYETVQKKACIKTKMPKVRRIN